MADGVNFWRLVEIEAFAKHAVSLPMAEHVLGNKQMGGGRERLTNGWGKGLGGEGESVPQ
jgi:hypothetical protein